MKSLKYIGVIWSLLLLSIFAYGSDIEQAKQIFVEANEAYKAEDYSRALELYKSLEEEYSSFELHYNLGNVSYKLNDIPSAILYYERARKIEPNNDDIETNLMIANQQVVDQIDAVPLSHVNDFWNTIISESNLFWWTFLSISLMVLAILFFVLFKLKRRKSFVAIGTFVLLFALLTFFLGHQTVGRIESRSEAIIFSEKGDVLNQPNGSQIEFVIHEGTKVTINEIDGEWSEIKIANGNLGWVRTEVYEEI